MRGPAITITLPGALSDLERDALSSAADSCEATGLPETSEVRAVMVDLARKLRATATGTTLQMQTLRHVLLYDAGGLDLFGGNANSPGMRLIHGYAAALDGGGYIADELDRLATEVQTGITRLWRHLADADELLAGHYGSFGGHATSR